MRWRKLWKSLPDFLAGECEFLVEIDGARKEWIVFFSKCNLVPQGRRIAEKDND